MDENEKTAENTTKPNIAIALAAVAGVAALTGFGVSLGAIAGDAAVRKVVKLRASRKAKKDNAKTEE